MEKNEVFEFVRKMKAMDHVILLYTDPKDKYEGSLRIFETREFKPTKKSNFNP